MLELRVTYRVYTCIIYSYIYTWLFTDIITCCNLHRISDVLITPRGNLHRIADVLITPRCNLHRIPDVLITPRCNLHLILDVLITLYWYIAMDIA